MRAFRYFIYLTVVILLFAATASTGCREAKPPAGSDKEVHPDGDFPSTPDDKIVEYAPIPIDAEVAGKELSLEGMRVTHIALEADKSYDKLVKVGVTVNDDYVGVFYADGWDSDSKEELRVGPGDLSVWVPVRGVWNRFPEANLLKLNFIEARFGDVDFPATYFKGKLHLKFDPDALEKYKADLEAKKKLEAEEASKAQTSGEKGDAVKGN